jgi:hypothetical protein
MTATKKCKSCLLDLETSAFAVDRRRGDGLFIYCRKCNAEKYRVYYNKNLDIRRAVMRDAKRNMTPKQRCDKKSHSAKHYKHNADSVKQAVSKYRAAHPEKIKATWLKGRYGLSLSSFNAMLDEQNSQCAICRVDFSSAIRPNVDHDHMTGAVRGLLCSNCNKGIGFLGDQASTVAAAVQYLIRAQESK